MRFIIACIGLLMLAGCASGPKIAAEPPGIRPAYWEGHQLASEPRCPTTVPGELRTAWCDAIAEAESVPCRGLTGEQGALCRHQFIYDAGYRPAIPKACRGKVYGALVECIKIDTQLRAAGFTQGLSAE